jgi:hypothetical protein
MNTGSLINMKDQLRRYAAISFAIALTALLITPCFSAEVVAVDRHLVRFDNGVVYDRDSALEWFAGPDEAMTWENANRWATTLEAAGGGWRMPTRSELRTIHHVGDGINNITLLLYTSGYWIWAGQTEKAASRWLFSFSYGGEGWIGLPPADGGRALAVRIRTRYPVDQDKSG